MRSVCPTGSDGQHRSVLSPVSVTGGVNAVEQWQQALAEAGELDSEVADHIISVHGSRGVRAIEAVAEGRVKQYNDFTVVVGHDDEYIVEDDGCTCKDAEYNLDAEDPTELCWHALAVKIAREIDAVDDHDMFYSEVRDLL